MKTWLTHDGMSVLHSARYLVLVSRDADGFSFAVVCQGRKASGKQYGGTLLDAKRDALQTLRDMLRG